MPTTLVPALTLPTMAEERSTTYILEFEYNNFDYDPEKKLQMCVNSKSAIYNFQVYVNERRGGHKNFKPPANTNNRSSHRDGVNTKYLNKERKIQNRIPKSQNKKTKTNTLLMN